MSEIKREAKFWTALDTEHLTLESPEEAVVEAFDYFYEKGVPILDMIKKHTPLEVRGFDSMIPCVFDAEYAAENFRESLYDEYGNPDGGPEDMLSDADYKKLIDSIQAAFDEATAKADIWACEKVETVVYSAEEVEAVLREEQPDWF